MKVSPEDVAFVEGYMCRYLERTFVDSSGMDDWFSRGNMDFNIHNDESGTLCVDAYVVQNDRTITTNWVRVWEMGDK